jgi:glutathione S-transferase
VPAPLKLISHKLCPYVQRAVIALTEKAVAFERIDVDLAKKPEWFLAISPLGKTPVLQVGEVPIFESAVILEYLEETQPPQLHPADALSRADHRAWIEFGSAVLNDIAGFYAAADKVNFEAKTSQLEQRRFFAISICSMRSPTLEFWRASRSSRAGVMRWRLGHRCALPSAPTTRRCFATL